MKHAGAQAIERLAPLIAELRKLGGLREPRPGLFYRGSQAFLHFHEDAAGDFADLKVDGDWERSRVSSVGERTALLRRVRSLVAASGAKRG